MDASHSSLQQPPGSEHAGTVAAAEQEIKATEHRLAVQPHEADFHGKHTALQLESQLEATETVQLQSASAGDAEDNWSDAAFKDPETAMQSSAGQVESSAEKAHAAAATQEAEFGSPEVERATVAQEQEQSFYEDKEPSVGAEEMQVESSSDPSERSLSHPEGVQLILLTKVLLCLKQAFSPADALQLGCMTVWEVLHHHFRCTKCPVLSGALK